MKNFLIFLFFGLIVVACSKSYIDVRYHEPVVEKTSREQEDEDFAALRDSYNVPLELGIFE